MIRVSVTIDFTKVSADQTDFPVYINLANMPTGFWSTVLNGGGDIRCYKSDGTTELARDVVSCNISSNTGELHVKYAGTLSSSVNTVIIIEANGVSSDYNYTATYGRNAVWSAVRGVWHLSESAGSATDSTGLGSIGSNTGVTYSSQQLGNGGVYNGSAFHSITDNSNVEPANAISFGGWITITATSSFQMAMAKGENAADTRSYELRMNGVTTKPEVQMRVGGAFVQARGDTNIGTGTRKHVYYTRSGTSHQIYIDAVSQTLEANTTQAGNIDYSTDDLWLGQRNGALRWNGNLDEMRLWATQLSQSWLTTEVNNQSSPSTFYSVAVSSVDAVVWAIMA